jgi:hypothetical protein
MIIKYGVIYFLRQVVQLRAKLYTTASKFNNAGTMCLERWELRFGRRTMGYADCTETNITCKDFTEITSRIRTRNAKEVHINWPGITRLIHSAQNQNNSSLEGNLVTKILIRYAKQQINQKPEDTTARPYSHFRQPSGFVTCY